jgi:NTP pyrophosphatase (non-canonical NTP hydrolase)
MNLQEYQNYALRTESIISEVVVEDKHELNYVLSAFITVGEMLDCYKKAAYYHNPKKYNEQFQELTQKLVFFAEALSRHKSLEHTPAKLNIDPRTFHGIVGIASESVELVMALEKALNGHEIDPVNVQEELSDIAWYNAILNDTLNLSWEEGLERNIAKLKARYPEKYSDKNAEIRDLHVERKILEGNGE